MVASRKGVTVTVEWYKIGIIALFSMCGVLYAQQNMIIDKQGDAFNEACKTMKADLGKKVDNAVLYEMIKTINAKQSIDEEQWKVQKKLNAETLKYIRQLSDNALLVNERLKALGH
jgi:hypothetical protein